jgi:hypothetical protein
MRRSLILTSVLVASAFVAGACDPKTETVKPAAASPSPAASVSPAASPAVSPTGSPAKPGTSPEVKKDDAKDVKKDAKATSTETPKANK